MSRIKETKLLMETWRRFLNEEVEESLEGQLYEPDQDEEQFPESVPGDYEVDPATQEIQSSDSINAEDDLDADAQEFMRRFDLPEEDEEDLASDPHLGIDDPDLSSDDF